MDKVGYRQPARDDGPTSFLVEILTTSASTNHLSVTGFLLAPDSRSGSQSAFLPTRVNGKTLIWCYSPPLVQNNS